MNSVRCVILHARTTRQGFMAWRASCWRRHPCRVYLLAHSHPLPNEVRQPNCCLRFCFKVNLHKAGFLVHLFEMYKLLLSFSLMQKTPRAGDTCRKSPSSVPGNRCNNKWFLYLLIFPSQDFKVFLMCSLWASAGPASCREVNYVNCKLCEMKLSRPFCF